MANLSLEHGNTDGSCFAYPDFQFLLCDFGALRRLGRAKSLMLLKWRWSFRRFFQNSD
jgi:hypothetical protein